MTELRRGSLGLGSPSCSTARPEGSSANAGTAEPTTPVCVPERLHDIEDRGLPDPQAAKQRRSTWNLTAIGQGPRSPFNATTLRGS